MSSENNWRSRSHDKHSASGGGRGSYRGRQPQYSIGGERNEPRGRNTGGANGGHVQQQQSGISYHALRRETSDDVTPQNASLFATSNGFKALLECGEDNPLPDKDWVDLMLQVIAKAFKAGQEARDIVQILSSMLLHDATSNFLSKVCVDRFITELTADNAIRIDKLINSLANYLEIYNFLCNMDPSAAKTLMSCLKQLAGNLMMKRLSEDQVEGIADEYQMATLAAVKKEKEALEEKRRLESERLGGRHAVEERPEGDFRDIPSHPVKEDLTLEPKLRKNLKHGGFADVDDYLDVQFRLLREDFISTLRNGIKEFKNSRTKLSGTGRFRSGDVKVYDGLEITTPTFSRDGIAYQVIFAQNIASISKINWRSTKRLIYGSLLCLSNDDFEKTVLFATIVDCDHTKIMNEGFQIKLLKESQEDYEALANQRGPFTAVESMAYYESYAHVLSGMQRINTAKFPQAKYIVRCHMEMDHPRYLRYMDASFRFINKDDEVTSLVNLISYRSDWPAADALGLNTTQYLAFKSALTQEFSVIQGPPGTGKTYVGLKIMEAILYNLYGQPGNKENLPEDERVEIDRLRSWRKPSGGSKNRFLMCGDPKIRVPVLVVCYTNHALDQFLEGILKFCPARDVVRVGGRSKSEALKPCNIKEKHGSAAPELKKALYEHKKTKEVFVDDHKIKYARSRLLMCQRNLMFHDTPELISDDEFYEQINRYAGALELSQYERKDAIHVWLECDARQAQFEDKKSAAEDVSQSIVDEETVDIVGVREIELERRMPDYHPNDKWEAQFSGLDESTAYEENHVAIPNESKDGQWMMSKQTEAKIKRHIRRELSSKDIMRESEVEDYRQRVLSTQYNISYDMPVKERWRMYRFWLQNYQSVLISKLLDVQHVYAKICRQGQALRNISNTNTLATATVIGMTTTSAARLQDVLQGVKPKIVIVEEAAEVLEAHITTALSESCEHLILIGDHKQLKPSPTVYDLAKQYNLDLSLFERMINNGFPVVTLDTQHRMRPEVSTYMKYIYDKLDDHPSVHNREKIRGLSTPVLFFNHKHPETSDPGTMSHSNKFEADMIVGLTRYLLAQNYAPTEITIITMYTGQLLLLMSKMPKKDFDGVKITSVDNFQGEENTIVILSLVRSNLKGNLGFVKVENRICVSLSRARYGMYVFGDFDMFSRGSDLWKKITKEAKQRQALSSEFNLSCGKHGNTAVVTKPEDFIKKSPAGGCTLQCMEILSCGHTCTWRCHSTDPDHEGFFCLENCCRTFDYCDHPCPAKCGVNPCIPCRVPKTLNLHCGHKRNVQCHVQEVLCDEPCPNILKCGHQCQGRCSQQCTESCGVMLEELCSRCNEMNKVPCHVITKRDAGLGYDFKCSTLCSDTLSCGHKCKGSCFNCHDKGHQKCQFSCGSEMPCSHKCQRKCFECTGKTGHQSCGVPCGKEMKCGHFCNSTCGVCFGKSECPPCTQQCLLECSHGIRCSEQCKQPCSYRHRGGRSGSSWKCQWGCEHDRCSRLCTESCSHVPCHLGCELEVKCLKCRKKYSCAGLCGDTCPPACPNCDLPQLNQALKVLPGMDLIEGMKLIYLRDCGHSIPVAYMDGYIANILPGTTIKCPLPECSVYVLNTPRYVPKTRVLKNTQNQEFASLQQKNAKTKRSKNVNLKDKARTQTQGIESYHQLDKSPAKTIERRPRNADELYELSEELAAANITYSFDRPRKLEIFNISDIEQKLDETDATIEEIQSQMRSQAAIEFGLYDDHGNDEEEDEDSNFF